jgi:hypothetical protein
MGWESQNVNHNLKENEIAEFIIKNDAFFQGKLSSYHNYSRVVALAHFDSLTKTLGIKKQTHVGIIAGSEKEFELNFLDAKKVTVLNRGEEINYDLNLDWSGYTSHNFSMTMCNQVLEHVFNPHLAFKNLCQQTAPSGYIYVSIPTLNCIHGEPDFYSSGFHPRFLEHLANENKLQILNIGYWGSYKYLINAVSGRWLPEKHLKKGLFSLKDLRYPVQVLFKDGRIKSKNNYITDCWALFKKPT